MKTFSQIGQFYELWLVVKCIKWTLIEQITNTWFSWLCQNKSPHEWLLNKVLS